MKRQIIIDCDPGHDDALAILMALASDKLEVKAITTSAGNQTPDKTLKNALKILSFIGVENIEVAQGAPKPLARNLIIADDVHGETGLDGTILPEPSFKPSKRSANEAMADILNNSSEKITLVATGPLTNIATLLVSHPEVKEKIEMISLMGGACFGGNITPAAEFNIYVDPEAADIVFKSGVPVVMCGLDVTLKAQIFKDEIDKIRNIGNKTGMMMAELLDFYGLSNTPYFLAEEGHVEGLHLHDPCAIAYLIDNSLFRTVDCNVSIETSGELTTGCTVVDYNGVTGKPVNAKVAFEINREKFIDLLYQSIKKFV